MTERNHTLSKDKLAEFKETQKDDKKKHALHCSLKIYKNERHQFVLKEKKTAEEFTNILNFFLSYFIFFISLFLYLLFISFILFKSNCRNYRKYIITY